MNESCCDLFTCIGGFASYHNSWTSHYVGQIPSKRLLSDNVIKNINKEKLEILEGWLHCLFKLHHKCLITWDHWIYQSALGFDEKTKMGYFMQDCCWWLCIRLFTTLGPNKSNSLLDYSMRNYYKDEWLPQNAYIVIDFEKIMFTLVNWDSETQYNTK